MGKLWIDQVGGYGSEVMGPAWPRLALGNGGLEGYCPPGMLASTAWCPHHIPTALGRWASLAGAGGGFLELLMALPKAGSSVGQGGRTRDGFYPAAGEPWGWRERPVRWLQPEVMLQLVLIRTCTTTNA